MSFNPIDLIPGSAPLFFEGEPADLTTPTLGEAVTAVAADVFDSCAAVVNYTGSAVGCAIETVDALVVEAPGYHRELEPMTPEELTPYVRHASMCAAIHSMQDDRFLDGFDGVGLRFSDMPTGRLDLAAMPYGVTPHGNKLLVDLDSGFKAAIIETEDDVYVVFGALCSLDHVIDEMREDGMTDETVAGMKKHTRDAQYKAMAKNVLMGGVPHAWQQADALIAQLKGLPEVQDKKLVLVGQCYGGSLATYAALRNEVTARAFNTFGLGAGLQISVGKERLSRADDFVTHISAETDYISMNERVAALDPWIPTLVPRCWGVRRSIPTAYPGERLPTHDFMLGSVMVHMGLTNRDTAAALTADQLQEKEFFDFE